MPLTKIQLRNPESIHRYTVPAEIGSNARQCQARTSMLMRIPPCFPCKRITSVCSSPQTHS